MGDFVTTSANATPNLQDRKITEYGILGKMKAILEDITLGNKRLEIGLTLREAYFPNSTLYNRDVWGSYNKCDITEFEVLECKILWSILFSLSTYQNKRLYLESGALPISHIYSIRRLSYSKTLLKRSETEITKNIFRVQSKYPCPGD